MNYCKNHNSNRLMVCFSKEEIQTMLIVNKTPAIIEILLKESSIEEVQNKVSELSSRSSNSRDEHELFAAIFGLHKEFADDAKICFYLQDSFDYKTKSISTVKDLLDNKTDPPDIVIMDDKGSYEIELKRYKGVINCEKLTEFIVKKVEKYSDPYNFIFIIQQKSQDPITINVFKDLHESLKKQLKKNLASKIALSFNIENKYLATAHVYPAYVIYKHPF